MIRKIAFAALFLWALTAETKPYVPTLPTITLRPDLQDFVAFPPGKPLPLKCRKEEVPPLQICADLAGQDSITT